MAIELVARGNRLEITRGVVYEEKKKKLLIEFTRGVIYIKKESTMHAWCMYLKSTMHAWCMYLNI